MNPWTGLPFSALTVDPELTILASSSPRRVEILERLGVKFTVIPPAFAEDLERPTDEKDSHIKYVCETAKMKALDVYNKVVVPSLPSSRARFIIASDTIVYLPETDQVLEKPSSRSHAAQMLKLLSGKRHIVYSAVVVLCLDKDRAIDAILVDYEETTSELDDLGDDFIAAYTAYSDETLDKAGACAEFGYLSVFVRQMQGTFYTTMGFPVRAFYNMVTRYLTRQPRRLLDMVSACDLFRNDSR